jgi:hypothetical protein
LAKAGKKPGFVVELRKSKKQLEKRREYYGGKSRHVE